ncbi:hypothetical protein AVEN_85685-1, partial [Araneus ventricosus]
MEDNRRKVIIEEHIA